MEGKVRWRELWGKDGRGDQREEKVQEAPTEKGAEVEVRYGGRIRILIPLPPRERRMTTQQLESPNKKNPQTKTPKKNSSIPNTDSGTPARVGMRFQV